MQRLQLLVVTVAIAFAAIGTSSASASSAVEFDREPSGDNCNPCAFTAAGESHLTMFGIRVMTCADTLFLEIHHDGTGHILYTNNAHDSGSCTRIACNGVGEPAAEAEFDALSTEETGAGSSTMIYRFCLETVSNPNATGTHCTAPVTIDELIADHQYALGMHTTCAGGVVEVEAAWATTDGDAIEITHIQ